MRKVQQHKLDAKRPKEVAWTEFEAINWYRNVLFPAANKRGLHPALCGSVMYRGWGKDLDLCMMSMDDRAVTIQDIMGLAQDLGVACEALGCSKYKGGRVILKMMLDDGRTVDVLCCPGTSTGNLESLLTTKEQS